MVNWNFMDFLFRFFLSKIKNLTFVCLTEVELNANMYKKYGKSLIATLLYTLYLIFCPSAFAQTYGLKFQGHHVTLDERTELNLTPDEYINIQGEFELSFDFKAYPTFITSNRGLFGYIVRIINEENNNVDLLSTPTPNANLNVVIGNKNSILSVNYPEDAFKEWIKLRVKILLSEDRIIFYTPDSFYVQDNVGFREKDKFKIIFGANDLIKFKTTDVPSMCIKDVKLFEKGKLIHHWPLNETEGTFASDRLRKKKVKVKNPFWLMRSHQSWNEIFKRKINGPLIFAADLKSAKIFIIGIDQLLIYSVVDDQIFTVKYKNSSPLSNDGYRAFHNSRDNKIYCYLVDGEPLWSLDITTGEWTKSISVSSVQTKYKHHNQYYCDNNNSVYLFGGYGLHKYNNEIRKINLKDNSISDLPTNDSIFQPRYLAGLGALNDTIYIFGGYGSETGDQRINPQSYYDLFGYSIKDSSLFKKFEIPPVIDDMSVANTMWIDGVTRNYYALAFEKTKFDGYLRLVKGKLDEPEIEFVGDEIPFQFLDVRSYACLFYMPQVTKLFACSSYFDGVESTNTSIYSISYPPNRSIPQSLNPGENSRLEFYWYLLILAAILIAGAILFIRRIRPGKLRKNQIIAPHLTIETDDVNSINTEIEYQLIFFGGFQVFDSNDADITNKFSPLLKELFLLILLHTFKNNKGISSEKITEILWYDKSEKSARNNRAVNIAKLRSILHEIGTCELSKKTGYWKIDFKDSGIKGDYIDFLKITASKNNLTKQKVNRLIEITQKGPFLSNVHYEWLDEFKSIVSDKIIDTLVDFAKSCLVKEEADFIVHLADSIFNFDVINEDAMMLKSKAQYCMGKHSHAKATYDKFFKEYMAMYGQEYDQSFLDILEIKE